MVDHVAARSAVERELSAMAPAVPDDSWVVLDEDTIEFEWGWVFFFDSKRHQRTGDFRDAVAGNAPFFVRRSDGAVISTGTAFPIEHYIREFERNGQLT